MRQGTFTPVSLPFKVLEIESIFSKIGYTPRGLMEKAVESGLIDQVFESWSGQVLYCQRKISDILF